jgi:hypothetical protein
VLAGMLLHVVPTAPEINILADESTRRQGLGRVIDTAESMAFNNLNVYGFQRGTT